MYSLTLQKATTIQCAIYGTPRPPVDSPSSVAHMTVAVCGLAGNFSKAKEQEFLVSRGKILELMRPDELGRMQTVLQEEVFGVIRSLQPFRLPGARRQLALRSLMLWLTHMGLVVVQAQVWTTSWWGLTLGVLSC